MRKICLVVCLLSCVINSPSCIADKPTVIRVLTYNIKHGEGIDGKLDLSRAVRVIKSENPDLVALQEVDNGTKRSDRVDQPKVLGELTGMQVVFGANIDYEGGKYGNAVLSKLPIVRSQNHPLPNIYNGEQRGVFEIEVKLPGSDSSLLLLATHFDFRQKDHDRVASASVINELVASRGNVAALLAGDLNTDPDSRPIHELQKLWQRTNSNTMLTFPASLPARQIDYIFYYPAPRWCVLETKVLDEPIASDHRPVLAVLKLCP